MPVEFEFERMANPDEQAQIEKTISDVLGNRDEHWTVTVVGFVSMHGYVVDVTGPSVRWGEFYPVQPDMLSDLKKHMGRLATLCGNRCVSGESFQALFDDAPVATR